MGIDNVYNDEETVTGGCASHGNKSRRDVCDGNVYFCLGGWCCWF